MRRLLAILTLAAALLPGAALAQGPTPPAQPPSSEAGIPDLVGYVSFQVQAPAWLIASCEAEPVGDWWNPAYQTARLIWLVKLLFYQLFCLMLSLAQFSANVIASAINLVLVGVNGVWRFLIFSWLTIRSWLYAIWYLFEVLRDWQQQALSWLVLVSVGLRWLISLAAQALALAGALLLLLLQLAGALLGLLGWLAGLMLGLGGSVLAALGGSTVPTLLSSTHPIYYVTRGLGEGVTESDARWAIYLLWGLAYVGAVVWLHKFLSRRQP